MRPRNRLCTTTGLLTREAQISRNGVVRVVISQHVRTLARVVQGEALTATLRRAVGGKAVLRGGPRDRAIGVVWDFGTGYSVGGALSRPSVFPSPVSDAWAQRTELVGTPAVRECMPRTDLEPVIHPSSCGTDRSPFAAAAGSTLVPHTGCVGGANYIPDRECLQRVSGSSVEGSILRRTSECIVSVRRPITLSNAPALLGTCPGRERPVTRR